MSKSWISIGVVARKAGVTRQCIIDRIKAGKVKAQHKARYGKGGQKFEWKVTEEELVRLEEQDQLRNLLKRRTPLK